MSTPTTLLLIMIGAFAGTALGAGLFIMGSPANARQATQQGLPERRDTARVGEEDTRTAVATVEKIDREKRTVTLKDEQGKSRTVNVPEEVQAFDRIKKGDKIRMTYKESIALAVHRPGEAKPEQKVTETTEKIEGAMPGRAMERKQTISAEVVSVDPKKNTVKIKLPEGQTKELTVQDPDVRARLKELKPGSVVQIDYTEAMAVTLEPAAK